MSKKPDDPSAAEKSSKWTRRSFLKGVGGLCAEIREVLELLLARPADLVVLWQVGLDRQHIGAGQKRRGPVAALRL